MAEPALFPEPERVEPLTRDGMWAVTHPSGWRYLLIGEDGELLAIQGHVYDRDGAIPEVLHAIDGDRDLETALTPDRIWMRELTRCPVHEKPDSDCEWCEHISPDEPWWDWSVPEGQSPEVHRGAEGYFPVTMIDLEG